VRAFARAGAPVFELAPQMARAPTFVVIIFFSRSLQMDTDKLNALVEEEERSLIVDLKRHTQRGG
jgi:hypothetical protein